MSSELIPTAIETERVHYQSIDFTVVISGNTNTTLISCKADCGIQPYVEIGGAQPSTSGTGLLLLTDAGANFPTLYSAADPAVWGLLVSVKDANPLYSPTLEILSKPSASTDTVSLRGTATTGVTASGNLALSVSSAGLDFDAAVATFKWRMRITYKRVLNA